MVESILFQPNPSLPSFTLTLIFTLLFRVVHLCLSTSLVPQPQRHKVADEKCVVLKGFRSNFGGGKSVGFACIYDSIEAVKKVRANLTN